MTKCFKIRLQVSVLRTNGPLDKVKCFTPASWTVQNIWTVCVSLRIVADGSFELHGRG